MSEEKLLTVREVSTLLGINERDVLDLAESGVMPAYKVGGVYIRFKKEQVDDYRKKQPHKTKKLEANEKSGAKDKIRDFFYFNDFYILAAVLILMLVFIVVQGL